MHDHDWALTITPTRAFVSRLRTSLPRVVFVAGLLISALLALTVHYVLIARIKSRSLAESERRYDLVVRGMSIGMWDWTVASGKLYWSAKFKDMLGITDKEFRAQYADFADRLHPDDKAATEKMLFDHIQKRGPYNVEYRLKHNNGSYIWIHAYGQAEWDKQGDAVRMAGSVANISARKLAEQALQTSEETFRAAMEYASVGIALVSPERKWIRVNKALCDLTGYSEAELLNRDIHAITHPDDLEKDVELVEQLFQGKIATFQLEKRYLNKADSVIWVLISASLARKPDGSPRYMVKQIMDISEKLEMDRMKSEFISVVSHELRTPLTSIRGSLGLIEGTMTKELPEKANRLIAIAHKNAERLILLINDILDLDKLSAGKMRFDMKAEQLDDIIVQSLTANQPYADKCNVSYSLGDLPRDVHVNVDANRLNQVLATLLSNAAKFSTEGETVTISAQEENGYVRICVEDHGSGIPDEFRPRIFGKFSQSGSAMTRTKGGTGLGLHISKEIIERMRGRIGFDTGLGKGTTFWIELPILFAAQTDATVTRSATNTKIGRPRILHIEDDSDFSKILAESLQGKVDLVAVTTLHAGRDLLQREAFSLIVLDIGLPDGDGLFFLNELPKMNHGNMPVLILSADEMPEAVQQKVAAAMVKSKLSEATIAATILHHIDPALITTKKDLADG